MSRVLWVDWKRRQVQERSRMRKAFDVDGGLQSRNEEVSERL